jgi:hypothetical protein
MSSIETASWFAREESRAPSVGTGASLWLLLHSKLRKRGGLEGSRLELDMGNSFSFHDYFGGLKGSLSEQCAEQ